jgi:putative transposase
VSDLRTRLIERLRTLADEHLPSVERALDRLEPRHADGPPEHSHWPHAPTHRLSELGTFIVTASTTNKDHLFRGPDRLALLENELLRLAKQYELVLEAWAVFSNHYHCVAHTTTKENPLPTFLAHLHTRTAAELNRLDGAAGRTVWFNYWDTRLTYQTSYLARLNYVHQNAVKHGLVARASLYPYCSAGWLERCATPAQVRTIYGFRTDRVRIEDDYSPVM